MKEPEEMKKNDRNRAQPLRRCIFGRVCGIIKSGNGIELYININSKNFELVSVQDIENQRREQSSQTARELKQNQGKNNARFASFFMLIFFIVKMHKNMI